MLAITFGESTDGKEIYELKGFNIINIVTKIMKLLNKE